MPHTALGDRSNGRDAGTAAAPRRCVGYAVYDPLGRKIGNAEELFVNWDGEPQYIRVRIGYFWARSVLIPVQFVERDDEKRSIVLKQREDGHGRASASACHEPARL